MKRLLFISIISLLLTACQDKTPDKTLVDIHTSGQDSTSQIIQTGELNGTLCFPSDYIPEMTVYLQDISNKKVYKILIQEDQRSFKFNDLPFGDYYAYAYTIEKVSSDVNGNSFKASGGFTKAVPCGLSVDCNDHSLIPIEIDAKITKDTISICDWYGALVPDE